MENQARQIVDSASIAVVIPSYRVCAHILRVLERIGPEVGLIYVVDDACPDKSGDFVKDNASDPRLKIIYNAVNLGVGGATMVGMQQAAHDGAQIIVKIDGDGQMDPALIPSFAGVILSGEADYAKGNRFFEPEGLAAMPMSRLIGNAGLSFLSKLSSGYWHTFDPTNGYVAIHSSLISLLPLEKISKRYFFESDLLFRLNILSARVVDVPMHAHYADELSHMKPMVEIPRFALAHLNNFGKRILYNYILRGFSIASIELFLGMVLLTFGILYGAFNWGLDTPATAGTVMIAALPINSRCANLMLAFLNYDIHSTPRIALHPRL
ncbi:MAG: glycosyltransferase family 2 protein, partial [Hyphomonadaceae bacterium]|nr:glycosyltransferase family 2 protein [Hyphomonadaceae bacterium]